MAFVMSHFPPKQMHGYPVSILDLWCLHRPQINLYAIIQNLKNTWQSRNSCFYTGRVGRLMNVENFLLKAN